MCLIAFPKDFKYIAFGKKFSVRPDEVFVIGGSFGGAAAILCSLDPRVKKVIANCAVVDWRILRESEKTETSNPSYASDIRDAFGIGYRLTQKNWNKLYSGKFYNPAHHVEQIDATKILMFHAKDDPQVPDGSVRQFSEQTGVKLHSRRTGGHIIDIGGAAFWPEIRKFFESR